MSSEWWARARRQHTLCVCWGLAVSATPLYNTCTKLPSSHDWHMSPAHGAVSSQRLRLADRRRSSLRIIRAGSAFVWRTVWRCGRWDCSARLCVCRTTSCMHCSRRSPLHHNVTVCGNEHIHSSCLNTMLTFRTVILSHACYTKALIRPGIQLCTVLYCVLYCMFVCTVGYFCLLFAICTGLRSVMSTVNKQIPIDWYTLHPYCFTETTVDKIWITAETDLFLNWLGYFHKQRPTFSVILSCKFLQRPPHWWLLNASTEQYTALMWAVKNVLYQLTFSPHQTPCHYTPWRRAYH